MLSTSQQFRSSPSLIGGFFWAFISDRFGRKIPSIGFLMTACAILAFPYGPGFTKVLGFVYGFSLSCAYAWGIWFTEIFPVRLRAHAAALLHGGHVISIIAPLIVALVARHYGISAGMSFAPVVFLLGAILWATLPETLTSSRSYRGWTPNA